MRNREALDAVIKAYDVRGVVGEDIDEAFVAEVGAAFATILREEGEKTVAIGHDMRPSSPQLADAFAQGVTSQGLDVIQLGLCATDELYFAAGTLNCAGAMFTASHNPAQYNGIKLCRAGATPVGEETGLREIKDLMAAGTVAIDGVHGSISRRDILTDYAEFLNNLVPLSQSRPLIVAVDAANGMGGHTVPAVFESLPFDVRPLYFELDGTFPNHEANPLDPKNLVDLQAFVKEQGADIGLAFDGDADRCFVVDEKGEPVSPSAICALVAERYLDNHPGATIIHNLITSKTVPELVAEKGGTAVRTRVGHSFIKAKMAEHKAVFGGEHSAHYYFQEFWNADSGMLAALHVLAALGQSDKPLSELMAEYSRYEASGEINSTVADQSASQQAILDQLAEEIESTDDMDGITVELKGTDAWFNVRASNTEPLLRLNVEAKTREEVDAIVERVLGIIRA
ncbi:phosphomannomutase/phosphoglucomutase [Corynebacterium sp. L4756]|uniref:phosphomannomutase/phosphoglucomutase n=1 Tax=unclassified Corynebacterium TaxID=2624378 RepID=UPI00374DA4E9